MRRKFNTTGACSPKRHYMVRLNERLREIKERYVDDGSYFIINRGRQYGKTTTLQALAEYLKEDYIVLSMDFQGISTAGFQDEGAFSKAFVKAVMEAFESVDMENKDGLLRPIISLLDEPADLNLGELFVRLSGLCGKAQKPVVLMIDEVDSAANNQVFLDFLAMLRKYYLNQERQPTFHSVILAGVYSIKNLKLKIRPDSEHQYNSPWNIAAEFDIDMSFSAKQIAGMLDEYEADNHTGMDVHAVAEEIYGYTSGYPYLASAICRLLDEKLPRMERFSDGRSAWGTEGISEAVKMLLKDNDNPLFESMVKQLDIYPDLRDMAERIIYRGEREPYSPDVKYISLGMMFGFLREENGQVVIANRIFEMRLLNMFIVEEKGSEAYRAGERDHTQFIHNGRLDMDLALEKFVQHFTDIYGGSEEKFLEENGRRLFLLYLKPIINGVGNYYIEAQTRDSRRTDVVVDYKGEQFVVELKIWRGNEYNERGEAQLAEYLDYFHLDRGYMLSFNFNKKKEAGIKEIQVGGRTIVEAVV